MRVRIKRGSTWELLEGVQILSVETAAGDPVSVASDLGNDIILASCVSNDDFPQVLSAMGMAHTARVTDLENLFKQPNELTTIF